MYIHSDMGWLRLVGSLKLYVSFAKYRLFYRALLQKRPRISRSLPPATTACFSRSIEPGVAEDKSFMCTNKSLHFPEI